MVGLFGTIFGTMLFVHYLGDYWIQTNHQAIHKGLTGAESRTGRWNCAKHAAGYTIAQAVMMPVVLEADGLNLTASQVWIVWTWIVFNGITHYIIDRRWTLEAAARLMGKGGWFDIDRPRATLHMDQSAHIVIMGYVSLAIRVMIG